VLDLGIVIVNYNTRDLLRECLGSLYASRGDVSYGVWVVDNASSDDSAEMVAREFPQACLIASPINRGYAFGNNLGLKAMGFSGSAAA
jgi:N-acetylglucosaminyl-diphospho-decaprenol L-rhamnosyltransferase